MFLLKNIHVEQTAEVIALPPPPPLISQSLLLIDNNSYTYQAAIKVGGNHIVGSNIDLSTLTTAQVDVWYLDFARDENTFERNTADADAFRQAIGWPDSGTTYTPTPIGPFKIWFTDGQFIEITQPAGNLLSNDREKLYIGGSQNPPIYSSGLGIVEPWSDAPNLPSPGVGDYASVEPPQSGTFTGTSTLRSFTRTMVATNFPGFDGMIWFTQGAGYATETPSPVSGSPSSVFTSSAGTSRIGSVLINSSDFASDFLTASGLSAFPSNTNIDLVNPVVVKLTTTRTNGSSPGAGELIFRARGVTRFTSEPNLIYMHNSGNSALSEADYISGSGTFDMVGGHATDVQTIQIGTVS